LTNIPLWLYLKKNGFPPGFRTLYEKCNLLDGQLRYHKKLGITGIDDLVKRIKMNER
jgi:hypothetical protein